MSLAETDHLLPHVEERDLPVGERILWQGKPNVSRFAMSAFRIRAVMFYFSALALWRLSVTHHDTGSWRTAAEATSGVVVGGLLAVVILFGLAWLYARSTGFTITDRRVVMRYGVALPSQLNIPLKDVQSAGLKTFKDGTGDIPLKITGRQRPHYFQIWPCARPFKLWAAEPMMRSIPDAQAVAAIVAKALHADAGTVPRTMPSVESVGAASSQRDDAVAVRDVVTA